MPNYKELTVAEYMELVQGEGLLTKSMAGMVMTSDTAGSHRYERKSALENLGDYAKEPNDETDDENAPSATQSDSDEDDEEDNEEGDDEGETQEPTEFELTISTNEPDRINDVLNPMGCETKSFSLNPMFLYEHGNTGNGPMSNPDAVLGQIRSITMDPKSMSIRALAKYFPRPGNLLVDKVLDMERKGLMPGNSMGWMPLAGIKLYDDGKRTVEKWELIEVSKVLLPINGQAANYRMNAKRADNARTAD